MGEWTYVQAKTLVNFLFTYLSFTLNKKISLEMDSNKHKSMIHSEIWPKRSPIYCLKITEISFFLYNKNMGKWLLFWPFS